MKRLNENCLSLILSFTCPLDTCRASKISPEFRSAVDSDELWNKFLPSDVQQVLSRSITPPNYTGKQLFFFLADSYVLLDDGNLSFSVDKRSGKKCWMIGAKQLAYSWTNIPDYWVWKATDKSRFPEVAALKYIGWVDIRAKISTKMLSPDITYEAYLVYHLPEHNSILHTAKTTTRVVGEREGVPCEEANIICPNPRLVGECEDPMEVPRLRDDAWLEIKIGEYFNRAEIDDELETRFMALGGYLKMDGDFMVLGVDFRPKKLQ